MSEDDKADPAANARIVRFPQSRTQPAGASKPLKVIGQGAMAAIIGAPERQTTGHWCSRCQGVWFGYLLEVACPACGNRRG